MNNHPTIEEAIEKNLTITYIEPGEGDEPVRVIRTCAEVIELGKAYLEHLKKENPRVAKMMAEEFPGDYPDREHVLDYLAVHWADIEFNPYEEKTEDTTAGTDPEGH